jgi:predicted ArsR family transcriptional regulator
MTNHHASDDPAARYAAAILAAPDPICTRLLATLTSLGWSGQVSLPQLSMASGVSARTVQDHRHHLVDAGLVQFTAQLRNDGTKSRGLRAPDRYAVTLAGHFGLPATG